MISIIDQLKNYPEEFIKALDIVKYKNFEVFLTNALKKFNIVEEFNKMSGEDRNGAYELFKRIYVYGFYNGVSFTLDPDKYFDEAIKDYPNDANSREDI